MFSSYAPCTYLETLLNQYLQPLTYFCPNLVRKGAMPWKDHLKLGLILLVQGDILHPRFTYTALHALFAPLQIVHIFNVSQNI